MFTFPSLQPFSKTTWLTWLSTVTAPSVLRCAWESLETTLLERDPSFFIAHGLVQAVVKKNNNAWMPGDDEVANDESFGLDPLNVLCQYCTYTYPCALNVIV